MREKYYIISRRKSHGDLLKRYALLTLTLGMVLLFGGTAYASPSIANGGWPVYGGNSSGTYLSIYDSSSNSGYVSAINMGANGENAPAIAPDGTVYVPATPYAIVAIKDGAVKWHFPESAYDGNLPHISTPLIDSEGNIYFGVDIEKKFYALKADGSVLWSCDMPPSSVNGFTPAVMDSSGNIYFGAGFSFYSLDSSGRIRWAVDTPGYVEHMPVVSGTRVFFVDSSPNPVNYNSAIYCVDSSSGSVEWKWTDGSPYLNSPSVLQNGTVMVTGNDGYPSSNAYLFSVYQNTTGIKMRIGKSSSSGVSLDASGNLYFTGVNGDNSVLYELYEKNWSIKREISIDGEATTPILDSAGNIYVLSYVGSHNGAKVFAFGSSGNQRWSADITGASWIPEIGPDGKIYAVQEGGSTLYQIGESPDNGGSGGSESGTENGGSENGGNSSGGENDDGTGNGDENKENSSSTPGFELLVFLGALSVAILTYRRKNL